MAPVNVITIGGKTAPVNVITIGGKTSHPWI